MPRREIIVGLDVGTTHVRAIIGELTTKGGVNIIGIGCAPSEGIKKGVIVGLDAAARSIRQAVETAQRMAGVEVSSVYLGINGSHIALSTNRGVVAVGRDDKEITQDDLLRVMQASQVMALGQEREVIEAIPKQFIVDGYEGIHDPVGMLGVRLEVETLLVTGSSNSIQNLVRCVQRAGYVVAEIVLTGLASSEVILSNDEKELGVALLDIGGGTTEISVFRDGCLQAVSVLPLGGDLVTSDIAMGLRTPLSEAEKAKCHYGVASLRAAQDDQIFEVANVSGTESRRISQRILTGIIEPRLQEMVEITARELRRLGYQDLLPAGLVLTGGVSLTQGIRELTEEMVHLSTRTALPDFIGVDNPIFTGAVGIVVYAARHKRAAVEVAAARPAKPGLIGRLRSWWDGFLEE
ncbi:MAG: cell division protein FtsA [Bacillota bacterium]